MGADARKLESSIREHAGPPSKDSSGSHSERLCQRSVPNCSKSRAGQSDQCQLLSARAHTQDWGSGQTLGSTTTSSQSVRAPVTQPAVQAGRDIVSTVQNLDPGMKLLLSLLAVYVLYVSFV